jgi:hypothetical protein
MKALRFAGVTGRGHGWGELDLGILGEADAVQVQANLVSLPDVDHAVIWREIKNAQNLPSSWHHFKHITSVLIGGPQSKALEGRNLQEKVIWREIRVT